MGQQHDLVWDSLGFSFLDLGGCCAVAFFCEWPTMRWSPTGGLVLSGWGTWESLALEFMIQFLIVFSAFSEWLCLN